MLARELGGVDHPLGPAFAEAAGDEDGVVALEPGGGVLPLEDLAVDPFGADADAVGHAAVGQRLGDGFVGVLQLSVLADDGDADLALGVGQAVHHVFPSGEVGARGGRDSERVEDGLVEAVAMIGQRRLVDRVQVGGGDHRILADIAEERDLGPLLVRDRLVGAADQHVWRDADGAEFLDGVLGRLGLELARGGDPGQQGEVHEDAVAARAFLRELPDRLEERQTLDIADGAADLAELEVGLVVADGEEVLDLVSDVRDHLDCLAEVVAAPLLLEDVLVDAAGRRRCRSCGRRRR